MFSLSQAAFSALIGHVCIPAFNLHHTSYNLKAVATVPVFYQRREDRCMTSLLQN